MATEHPRSQVIFVDTNIPMYVAGKEHPQRDVCRQVFAIIAKESVEAETSTEVHQEILHRYLALRLPEDARTVSQSFQAIVPTVLPVTLADIVRARKLGIAYPKVAARDLIHVAVMLNNGLTQILSVDGHFDTVKEVVRISPEAFVASWNQPRAATAATSVGQND